MQIDSIGQGQLKKADVAQNAAQRSAARPQDTQEQQDHISLNSRPKWAQVLVQQALQFSLEINGGKYQAPKQAEEVTPETLFDYEEVAKNVLQFVTGRLGAARADGKEDDALTKMMEQARKGVDMGFAEARKLLGSYATDNEDIKTGIDQSYKLIQEGLDQFEKEFFGDVSSSEVGAAKMANRQQGTLEIETKEGDKVVLRFSDSWQFKSSQGDRGSKVSFQNSQSFSFSLQGDLSDTEMSAIGKLVKDIDELGSSFFAGNLDQLMGKVGELQLDDSQLVGFSLKLKQHSKLSAAYQGNSLQDALKPLADYLPRLKDWQQQADANIAPTSQQNLTQTVLAAQGHDNSQVQRFNGFNQRLLNALHQLG